MTVSALFATGNLIELHPRKVASKISLHTGSGNYFIAGGKTNPHKLINIFYHKPKRFNSSAKVLLVIPGAGRNAWSYRDSWIEASEKHNVLILSPAYATNEYDFGAYHLGGTVSHLIFKNEQAMKTGKESGKYHFKDEELVFNINHNADTWLFEDFDRIFDIAIAALKSKQTSYDIFGHSAGGQILHRLAIFTPLSKADRIIAANSGSYTVASFETTLPFGLKNSALSSAHLKESFATNLTLLIGALDNEQETRGSMLHTPTVDKQGLGRLERSYFFFEQSKATAHNIGASFNWQHKIVKEVGHDFKLMGKAAANLLYEGKK